MLLFTDDMIVYVENPMRSIRNLSELKNSARWQIIKCTFKCQCHFLYTGNEHVETETKNSVLLVTAVKT